MERFRGGPPISIHRCAASEAVGGLMLTALFFLTTFATLSALLWAGIQLLQPQADPLADRLQELQSSAMVSSGSRSPRRNGRGGFLNWLLYIASMTPGGE